VAALRADRSYLHDGGLLRPRLQRETRAIVHPPTRLVHTVHSSFVDRDHNQFARYHGSDSVVWQRRRIWLPRFFSKQYSRPLPIVRHRSGAECRAAFRSQVHRNFARRSYAFSECDRNGIGAKSVSISGRPRRRDLIFAPLRRINFPRVVRNPPGFATNCVE